MTENTKFKGVYNLKNKLTPSFHIEGDGGGGILSFLISGVIGIGEYSSESVCLKTAKESLIISGKSLNISVFERKTVEITGKIDTFTINSKNKRRRDA